MKRHIPSIVILLVSISILAFASKGPAALNVNYNNLKIMVDGAPLQTSVEPFIMKDGKIAASYRRYLPRGW